MVLLGDINEDQLSITNNKLKTIMLLNNMTNVITNPTRVTSTTSTLIDRIVISNNINCLYSDTLITPSHISDHYCTLAYVKYN